MTDDTNYCFDDCTASRCLRIVAALILLAIAVALGACAWMGGGF